MTELRTAAGGFGSRGVEGKILAANYARTQKRPYLGKCLGMQVRSHVMHRWILLLQQANVWTALSCSTSMYCSGDSSSL